LAPVRWFGCGLGLPAIACALVKILYFERHFAPPNPIAGQSLSRLTIALAAETIVRFAAA